jgi:hypothetical protein
MYKKYINILSIKLPQKTLKNNPHSNNRYPRNRIAINPALPPLNLEEPILPPISPPRILHFPIVFPCFRAPPPQYLHGMASQEAAASVLVHSPAVGHEVLVDLESGLYGPVLEHFELD